MYGFIMKTKKPCITLAQDCSIFITGYCIKFEGQGLKNRSVIFKVFCLGVKIYVHAPKYRIRGLFGGDFNLAVWRITSESPNLNRAILKAIF